MGNLLDFHYGCECGDCTHCMAKDVDLPSELIPRIMAIYCEIDNRDLGNLHNERAVLCHHYEERKYHFIGLHP